VQNTNSIRNTRVNSQEEFIIESEIQKLLNMNVIEEAHSEDGEYISPIFVRPKKNGEYRMILNLKESWTLDPESAFVDAFTINWGSFYCYLFPPFSLLGQCMRKIQRDKVEAIVGANTDMVCSDVADVNEHFLCYKSSTQPVTLPYKEMKHSLNLMICRISEDTMKCKEFLETQSAYYYGYRLKNLQNYLMNG